MGYLSMLPPPHRGHKSGALIYNLLFISFLFLGEEAFLGPVAKVTSVIRHFCALRSENATITLSSAPFLVLGGEGLTRD